MQLKQLNMGLINIMVESVIDISKRDKALVDKILNDRSLPEMAEDGKGYIIKWADGRATFAVKSKSELKKWYRETEHAEIVSIKYEKPPEIDDKKLPIRKKI